MSYLVLARKWRPQRFADLTGQDVIVRTLKNALSSNHMAHAYLMTGIRGVGKTTISRLMAMAVNCTQASGGEPCGACDSCTSIAQGNNLDVQEMDAASHTGVDDIREILDGVRYPPVHLKTKVYIIDEAHMLSKQAFNALLKTLEEPPENVLFILATTEIDKLPITVRSRCQRFDLRRLDVNEISDYLAHVLTEEKIEAQAEALQIIARASDGSVRDALSLTERVLAYSDKNITVDDVQQSLGLLGTEHVQALAEAIFQGDANLGVDVLRQSREMGIAPAFFLQSLAECLHEMVCCKVDASLVPQGVSKETNQWLIAQSENWAHQALDMRYQILVHGLRDLMLVDEQRGAEMIVMRLAHLNHISPPENELPAQKKTLKKKEATTKREFTQKITPAQTLKSQTSTSATSHQDKEITAPIAHNPAGIAASDEAVNEVEHGIESHPETKAERKPEPLRSPDSPTIKDKPSTWEEAMNQYHTLKPGIAAILEHVICKSFEPEVRLLLNPHQEESLAAQERTDFAEWLGKDVVWLQRDDDSGESLLEKKQREKEEYERSLWQHAETDPNVKLLQDKLGCRLVSVSPPEIPQKIAIENDNTRIDGES